ncbi:MAG: cutinase family protein [Intrasporangium sp.]|uniref:cutinase family protein n=1 Tax=Intrasporangium sp. TaxID=1925024 RepID=UPI002648A4A0|nr:cutinase family protein [Intrasporangium sp.]MDN5794277.1 cutinase family protein [Intrasporangium sp.]
MTAPPAQAVTCRAFTVIMVRGTDDGGSKGTMGTQLPTALGAFAARKGWNKVTSEYVTYPATGDVRYFLDSMPRGRAALKAKINTYIASCPSTKIALLGYSQGAHIVGDVVVGMSAGRRGHLQGVGLIGDPMMNPRLTGSVTGDRSRGGMFGQRASWPSGVFVYDVCNKGDRVCASHRLVDSLGYVGGAAKQHTGYTGSTYSPIGGFSGAWLIGYHVANRA